MGSKIKTLAIVLIILGVIASLICFFVGNSAYQKDKDCLEYATVNGGAYGHPILEEAGNKAYAGQMLRTYSIIGIILPHPIAIKEIPQYLLNIIWGNDISIGAIWFLPAIFFCKLFGGLIISLKDKYHLFYYFLFILAFLPAFFLRGVYLPLFIGAAACGLPFFLLGNEFMKLSYKRIHGKYLLIIAFIAAIFTIVLSPMHDFVLIAANNYGNNIFLYYINAFTGIIAIISTSIILNRYTIRFVTITAYGNIATLWLHGVILSLFNYYLPKMLGYDISAYPLLNAIIYSMITYALCYIFIIVADKYCPTPFGLRGRL